MATQFKNKIIQQVGLSHIIALETDSATRSTIIGLSLANLTESVVAASVLVQGSDSTIGYFMKDIMIPPNSSLRALSAGEKLILAPNNQLQLQADEDAALDAVISYVDIV